MEIPDDYVIARGGERPMPAPGPMFSASMGSTLEDSATGLPHGTIRVTTAGEIRRGGGQVTAVPEMDPKVGIINRRHVHVVEGGIVSVFGPPQPNPIRKTKRFGGRDYHDHPFSQEGAAP